MDTSVYVRGLKKALRAAGVTCDELARELTKLLESAVRTSEREELTVKASDLENALVLVATLPQGVFDQVGGRR